MADCCLVGETREETLISHVRWLANWATTMTKKAITLSELLASTEIVDDPEARRLIISGGHRVIGFLDDQHCTREDPTGLKALMTQFQRAAEMVKIPENIPCRKLPESNPATQTPDSSPRKAEGLARSIRFYLVAGESVPDIQFSGSGSSESVVRATEVVRKCLLADKVNSIDDIQAALNIPEIRPCRISMGERGDDSYCSLKIEFYEEDVEEQTNE